MFLNIFNKPEKPHHVTEAANADSHHSALFADAYSRFSAKPEQRVTDDKPNSLNDKPAHFETSAMQNVKDKSQTNAHHQDMYQGLPWEANHPTSR